MPVGPKVLSTFKAAGRPAMPLPSRIPGRPGAGAPKPPAPSVKPAPAAAPPAPAAPDGEAEPVGEDMSDEDLVQLAGHLVDSGQGDPTITALMEHYDADVADGAPPVWAPDAEVWSRSVELVQPETATWKLPWLVVANLYSILGGEVDGGEAQEHGGQAHAEPDGDEEEFPENPV